MKGGGARYNMCVEFVSTLMDVALSGRFRRFRIVLLALSFALVCIVGLALIWLAFAESSNALAQQAAAAFDYEVEYTPSGFVPNYLEVPIGSRVAFVNDATGTPLWVASDPYPTRTDYPALDAQKSYSSGETYLFQFTQTGTFGYHNQDAPVDDATIVVNDPAHPTPDISKTQARQQAIRDKLVAMLVPGDSNSIFTVIDAIEADPVTSLDCHDIAHDLGHRAYELYGFSGAMTYDNPERVNHASVMDICAGGYVHGILEEASLHDPNFGDHPGALCADVPSDNTASCYHGVGHALMFFTARDIPKSLIGCRTMPDANDASRCFEGVWMETFWGNTEHSGPDTLGWDLNNPLAICKSVQADAKPACFLYSSFGYLRTHVKDYAGAVALCTHSGLSDSDVPYCLKGVGITMVTHFQAQHLEQSEPFVEGLSDTDKLGFYEGVMGYGRLSGLSEEALAQTCAAMKSDAAVCTQAIEESK